MPRTLQGLLAWGLANPVDTSPYTSPPKTWNQKCVSAGFRGGDFGSSAPSAYYVAHGAEGYGHHLYTEDELPFAKIPASWWAYFDIGGDDNGHVIACLGDGRGWCANSRVVPMTPAHDALGYLGPEEYRNLSGATYLGSSPYWLNETLAGVGLDPDGGNVTPLLSPKEDEMFTVYISESASTDGVIPAAGLAFEHSGNGPIRILSQLEAQALDFWAAHGFPYRRTEWPGDSIRTITRSVGLYEWVGFPKLPADNVPILTGRVVFADPKTADYPKVSASVGNVTVDNAPILKAIQALKIPTVEEILARIRSFWTSGK
ncbi:MAG: hypothetical protein ABJB03_00570 [Rhodoglobus sp.]